MEKYRATQLLSIDFPRVDSMRFSYARFHSALRRRDGAFTRLN